MKNPTENFEKFVTVSFQIPDGFNSPGYWESYEDEPLLIYKGEEITDKEFVKMIANLDEDNLGEWKVDMDVIENLEYNFEIKDLIESAKEAEGDLEKFLQISSKKLFQSFEEALYEASDVLDEGEETVPYFKEYYVINVKTKE